MDECCNAIVLVGNGMFGRKWTKSGEKEKTFDKDTHPEKIRIIEALKQIEAQSLNLVVEEMKRGNEDGCLITLASDSTTRRDEGKFIGQWIHIGKEAYCLLGISTDTKEDIALQLSMGIELLSICSGVPVKDMMEQLDTLFTDSVEHNSSC